MSPEVKRYSIDELKAIVAPIAEKHGISKMYLFGSVARGDADEFSDYDFCIDHKKDRCLFALSGLKADLNEAVGCETDLCEIELMKPDILRNFLSERIILYGVDELPPKETIITTESNKSVRKQKNRIFTIKRLLESCTIVNELCEQLGCDEKKFRADKIYQRACAFHMLLIGDIVNSHMQGLKNSHPEISWEEIAIFSTVIDCVDIEEKTDFIWETITVAIPELKRSCESILEKETTTS